MKAHLLFRRFLLLVLLLVVLPTIAPAFGKNTETDQGKLVFLPFTIKTQPPQEHLRAGLTSVLATRMADRTGLAAVHGAEKTSGLEELLQKGRSQEAKKILHDLHGDWLLVGSLEQQPSGYEIKIHVFGSGKAAPASFSRHIDALDKTIPTLDTLADEIAAKVFHQKAAEEEQPVIAADKDGMGGLQTAHPDKAYRDGSYVTAEAPRADEGAFRTLAVSSSGELNASFRAMDVGDLDGDGREEIVLLEQDKLLIYRFSADRFQQISERQLPSHLGFHALYLADFDRNGRAEIYISASNGENPSSQVLEWDGKQFRTIAEQVPYYLRPDKDSSGKTALLGQAGDTIYRMEISRDGNLNRAEEVPVPQGFGLHDFIRADLDGDGRREFIGITQDNLLMIMDQNGKPLWKSTEIYGASRDALRTLASRRQAELDHPDDLSRSYIHARIIAQDLTGDGKPEIIISRNRVTNVEFFRNMRYFEGSSVAALSWDGTKMNTLWESQKISGYTVDYQVSRNSEQPGRFHLVLTESDDSGNPLYFWSKEKSVIRVQEMSVAQEIQR